MGRRAITRYGGVAAAALLLLPGAVVHRPVHEVQVVASKFMFEPAAIEVTAGEPVRLVLRSKDTVHGLSGPGLKIDVQIPNNRGGPARSAGLGCPSARPGGAGRREQVHVRTGGH